MKSENLRGHEITSVPQIMDGEQQININGNSIRERDILGENISFNQRSA